MKCSWYSFYFTSIVLLALVTHISGCSKSAKQIAETIEKAGMATQKSAGEVQIIMFPGDVPLEMVWIPPGNFLMGSPDDEQDRFANEGPQHEVTIANGFWMSKYETTQAQWQAVMENNLSHFQGEDRPVDSVSWNDVTETDGFIDQLNKLSSEYNIRLPSEAEWEYAYRAGTATRYYWGDDPNYTEMHDYAWYWNNSLSGTNDVGQKLPNPWGLYDMTGNVWEWCEDDWHGDYHGAPTDGSAWVNSPRGSRRPLRGGAWNFIADYCRTASRNDYFFPDDRVNNIGFRVVCALD